MPEEKKRKRTGITTEYRKLKMPRLYRKGVPGYTVIPYGRRSDAAYRARTRRWIAAKRRAKRRVAPKALLRTGGLLPYPSNIERKFVDNSFTTDATTTAFVGLLNGMAPGTSASTRIGRRILMKSINLRFVLSREDQTSATQQWARFMVVYDRQTNAAAPATTDIIDAATVQAQRNMSNVLRFYMLYDQVFTFDGSGGRAAEYFQKYIRINLPVSYNAGTAWIVTGKHVKS